MGFVVGKCISLEQSAMFAHGLFNTDEWVSQDYPYLMMPTPIRTALYSMFPEYDDNYWLENKEDVVSVNLVVQKATHDTQRAWTFEFKTLDDTL